MTIDEILAVPEQARNQDWETKFFQVLTTSNVRLLTTEPQMGPDGFPYLIISTNLLDQEGEPFQKILHWLSTRGIGVVVNPENREYPDFVFTYGMIWLFMKTGWFYRQRPQSQTNIIADQISSESELTETIEFNPQELQNAGEPTEEYFPKEVRKILREFFRDQGVLAAKILVISVDNVNYDLAFSLESLGNPPESEHEGIAEALGWFLPPHYSLVLVSEKGMPKFVDL